jgi:hypothetical protein
MQTGILQLTQDRGWIIKYEQMIHTLVGKHDYKVSRKESEIGIHPKHNLWLIVHAKHGANACFEVETIATGSNEFHVLDTDVAVLKQCDTVVITNPQD